jgi:hypothetical protein
MGVHTDSAVPPLSLSCPFSYGLANLAGCKDDASFSHIRSLMWGRAAGGEETELRRSVPLPPCTPPPENSPSVTVPCQRTVNYAYTMHVHRAENCCPVPGSASCAITSARHPLHCNQSCPLFPATFSRELDYTPTFGTSSFKPAIS